MDIFIDKFAQRRNAQEMIKANYMAEAEENERLTAKLSRYDEALQDMRRLSLQNVENAERVKRLLDEGMSKIQEVQKSSLDNDLAVEILKKQQGIMENVLESLNAQQVSMEEMLKEIPASVTQCLEQQNTAQQAAMEEMMLTQKRTMEDLEKASEDFMHKESVKVYRNVQAVLEEELPKQTGEITGKMGEMIGNIKVGKGVLVVSILTLLAALANIGVLIAHLWGYL